MTPEQEHMLAVLAGEAWWREPVGKCERCGGRDAYVAHRIGNDQDTTTSPMCLSWFVALFDGKPLAEKLEAFAQRWGIELNW